MNIPNCNRKQKLFTNLKGQINFYKKCSDSGAAGGQSAVKESFMFNFEWLFYNWGVAVRAGGESIK